MKKNIWRKLWEIYRRKKKRAAASMRKPMSIHRSMTIITSMTITTNMTIIITNMMIAAATTRRYRQDRWIIAMTKRRSRYLL